MPSPGSSHPLPNIRLREERLRKKWSQQELADRVGTTKLSISRWERNVTAPGPYFRLKLCTLFGKSAQELGLISENKPDAIPIVPDSGPSDSMLLDPTIPRSQSFIGHENIVPRLAEQLSSCDGLFAITGLPGVGKTALVTALAYAPAIRQHFCDGILWVGLGHAPQLQGLMSRWGVLLGLTEADIATITTLDAWARCLHDHIGNRRMLLILDDVWQLSDAVMFQIGGNQCVHVLTTRFPAIAHSFAGASVFRLTELDASESLTLLDLLSPQVVREHPVEANRLVQAVGGLPLAVTLVGHFLHVQVLSGQPRRVSLALERLYQQAEHRLQVSEPQLPWKQSPGLPIGAALSLQTTLEISDHSLPLPAQTALRALSVFPSKPHSFAEEAALAVCHTSVEVLDLLVDSGLLESYRPGRYQLHQVIADYALFHRTDERVKTSLVDFYLDFVQKHAQESEVLEQDLPTILTTIDLAFKLTLFAPLIQLVLSLMSFLEKRRLYDLADSLLLQAQHAAQNLNDHESVARTWLHRGKIAELRCDAHDAEEAYLQGLTLAQQLHHQPLIAALLVMVASVLDDQGDFVRAQTYLLEGLTAVQEVGNQKQLCVVFKQLGETADNLGENDKANTFYQQGLAIALQEEMWEVASALLQDLGVKAARRGEYQQANAYYEDGLAYAIQTNDLHRQSALLMNLGMLAFHQQQYDQAISLSKESLKLARIVGHRLRISSVLQNLGMLEGLEGQYAQAEVYLQESLELARQIGHRWLITETQGEMAMLLFRQRQFDHAQRLFQTMLTDARAMKGRLLEAQALFGLAQVLANSGSIITARNLAQESLDLFTDLDDAQCRAVAHWLSIYTDYDKEESK